MKPEYFALKPPPVPARCWVGGAEFSPCRTWRYRFWRHVPRAEQAPYVCFVALNPSSADEKDLDPTLTREIGFAQSWSFERLYKGNLFGLVSTDPRGLYKAPDPLGPSNQVALASMVKGADLVVVAWGQERAARERAGFFLHWARSESIDLWCLGTNDDGSPKHPLYLPSATRLQRYRGAA